MAEVNFCPFCDSPAHKLVLLADNLFYCKQCENFFTLKEEKLECSKCNSTEIKCSDFPSPDGSLIFQCEKCKKMFDIRTFLKNNEKEEKVVAEKKKTKGGK
jgi:ribosomal protein L37AE/L43A